MRKSTRNRTRSNSRPLPLKFRQAIEENARRLRSKIKFNQVENIDLKEELVLRTVNTRTRKSSPITLNELLSEVKAPRSLRPPCYHVCLKGPEGVGKTTLLSKFVQDAQSGKITQIDHNNDLVHWVKCCSFKKTQKLKVSEFLFDELIEYVGRDDFIPSYEWITNNPTNLTFVLDDLDTLISDFDRQGLVGPCDVSTPNAILLSLLDGTLFVGCTVVSSCNDEKFECLMEGNNGIDIEKTVLVCGLSHFSIDRIALKYLGESCYSQSFVHFKKSSPYLLTLCENPTILAMALTVLEGRQNHEYLPKGMTGVIIQLLLKVARAIGHFDDVFNKWKRAAYLAKKEDCTSLKYDHLKIVNVHEEDLRRSVYILKNFPIFLVEESSNDDVALNFVHPVLLNALCALHIAELEWDKFQRLVPKMFGDPRFPCVMRYIYGFTLEDGVFDHALELFGPGSTTANQIKTDRKTKSELLRFLAADAFTKLADTEYVSDISEQFNVFHIIAESGKELKKLVFQNFQNYTMGRLGCHMLRNEDVCALAICICFKIEMEELVMPGCFFPTCLLEVLHECISNINSSAKINAFHFDIDDFDTDMETSDQDVTAFSHFLVHVTKLCNFNGWRINAVGGACLQETLDDLQKFDLKVYINEDDVLTAQSRWCDVTQEIIGPGGGSIALNDCELDFHRGTIGESSKVIVEMKNCVRFFPKDYLLLSPSIRVGVKADLHKAVLVSMKPWCITDDDHRGYRTIDAEVLHLEDGSENWKPMKTVGLSEDGNIQFKCRSFSTILIAIKQIFPTWFFFPLTAFISAKGDTWCVTFCLDHKSAVKEAEKDLENHQYEELCLPINSIRSKIGDIIRVRLRVDKSEGFSLDIPEHGRPKFRLTRMFINRPKHQHFTFLLKKSGRGSGKCTVDATYKTLLNGESVEGGSGAFQRDVSVPETMCDVSRLGREERLEDAFREIRERFANRAEYKKFAMDRNGLCLGMVKVEDIEQDNFRVFDQQMEMLRAWKEKEGENATAAALRNLVASYFDDVPVSDIDDRLRLAEEFEKAIAYFKTYHEWVRFATSDWGLGLEQEFVDKVIEGQQNITKAQKQVMLDEWKGQKGDEALSKIFRDLLNDAISHL